jgi:hypothetical protein
MTTKAEEEFIKEATKKGLWVPVMLAVTQSILNHPKLTGLDKMRQDAIRQAALGALGYPDLFNRSMAERLLKRGADQDFIRIIDAAIADAAALGKKAASATSSS